MIGKSQNPRCFKTVKSKPIEYKSNKKAWMTSELFEEWLLKLDNNFHKQNRTIILFIDNSTAHNSIPIMGNVKVIFFPPNMTSVVQPMDQSVIKNFKHFYRRYLVQTLLTDSLEKKHFQKSTSFKLQDCVTVHGVKCHKQQLPNVSKKLDLLRILTRILVRF
uniref:DDE-1 domain-containing protein n=1 Tax=Clastoptera arizonana TaxID=38151 RepID=A0A1B6D5P3_9HEMI